MTARCDFIPALDVSLGDFGMRVSRNVELPAGPMADLFASRTYFSWKGFVILSQHVVVRDFTDRNATVADMQELFDAGFRQAQQVNRVPLVRRQQFGFMVMPCLVVDSADPALIRYAEGRPRKHLALFEFPVVVDRQTGQIHYYDQTAVWGAFYFSDMRKLVARCIVPAVMHAERSNPAD